MRATILDRLAASGSPDYYRITFQLAREQRGTRRGR